MFKGIQVECLLISYIVEQLSALPLQTSINTFFPTFCGIVFSTYTKLYYQYPEIFLGHVVFSDGGVFTFIIVGVASTRK